MPELCECCARRDALMIGRSDGAEFWLCQPCADAAAGHGFDVTPIGEATDWTP